MLTLVPDEIERYAADHTTPLPPLLEELIAATEHEFGARSSMLSGPVSGRLLQFLVAMTGARSVLEIGMFTGFSALMMAEALPPDGRLITCDVDAKAIGIARSFFARSPYGGRIDVREGPALDTIARLQGPFGFVFIDADKGNYINYYEAALPLLAEGGVIAVDNVLWSGRVLDPKEPDDHAIVAFNDHIRADGRVVAAMLTVRDGVMLIRRRRP